MSVDTLDINILINNTYQRFGAAGKTTTPAVRKS